MSTPEHKVCRLIKSLYGHKQTPKQCHEKFDSVMIKDEFTLTNAIVVYIKIIENTCFIICLYVDDMLILETNIKSY